MRDKYSDVRRAPPYLAPVISLRLNTSAALSLPTLRQDLGASEEKLPLSTFVGTASRKPNHIEEISGEADGLLPEEWAQGYPNDCFTSRWLTFGVYLKGFHAGNIPRLSQTNVRPEIISICRRRFDWLTFHK